MTLFNTHAYSQSVVQCTLSCTAEWNNQLTHTINQSISITQYFDNIRNQIIKMDHPPRDPGDGDCEGAGAFVTPRENPPISMAVEEDTENLDIIDDDDNSSMTESPSHQIGAASNIVLTRAFVSARGSPETPRERMTAPRMMTRAKATSRISLTPSVEWLDAYSEIISDPDDIMVVLDDDDDDVDGVHSVEESLLTRSGSKDTHH